MTPDMQPVGSGMTIPESGLIRVLTQDNDEYHVLNLEKLSEAGFRMEGSLPSALGVNDVFTGSCITDHSDGTEFSASVRNVDVVDGSYVYDCQIYESSQAATQSSSPRKQQKPKNSDPEIYFYMDGSGQMGGYADERRSSQRMPVDFLTLFKIDDKNLGNLIIIKDISDGGVRFQCHQSAEAQSDIAVNQKLEVGIKADSNGIPSAYRTAEIVNIHSIPAGQEYRCRFVDNDSNQSQAFSC